jgi:phage-related protein
MFEPNKEETIQEKATAVAEKSWDKSKNAASSSVESASDFVTDKAASAKESVGGVFSNVKETAEDKTKTALGKADEMLSK